MQISLNILQPPLHFIHRFAQLLDISKALYHADHLPHPCGATAFRAGSPFLECIRDRDAVIVLADDLIASSIGDF
jgi:hypothetical protein